MIKLTVYFDEHHVGSSKELARIIADNWPAIIVQHEDSDQMRRYEYGSPDVNNQILHACEYCNANILEHLGMIKNGVV